MPAKRKHKCYSGKYFEWKLYRREGVWCADGRTNSIVLGRRSLGTRDFDEAKTVLAKLDLKMAVERGLAEPEAITVFTVEETPFRVGRKLYEEHVARSPLIGGTRITSQKRYRAILDKFIAFVEKKGLRAWNQVSDKTLGNYIDHLESEGYAYATQYLEATTLKQIVGFLIKEKRLPAENKVTLPLMKPKGTDTYCWTESEVKAILTHCATTPTLRWLHDVIFALAHTGLRIGELIGLRWTNVNFETGMISLLDESLSRRKRGHRERQTTKGGYSRSFPIQEDLEPILQAIDRHPDGYVFHGPLGGRLKADTVRNVFIRVVLKPLAEKYPTREDEIGFKDGRLHSFRHFFCSLCANRNVAQQVVMKWLGHKDSKLVTHYYHLHDDEARRQMRRITLSYNATGTLPAVGSGS